MANPLQRAVFRRKLIYAGLIVGLFTLSIFWRGKLPVPFARQVPLAADLTQASVLGRAESLELRELDQGDPELLGTALRLTLFGTRGAAVTALWWGAIEKQKRNEFHEFELLVQAVTRLQPNFITPWLYQSWNLAYNVSVEHDKLGDMYFYIARGIDLLADGDRVNTRKVRRPDTGQEVLIGSPDIRYNIGLYYQNKFSVSDKVNTLRSLMQVSCIRPADRKRTTFEPSGQGVDPAAFARFCKANPQLVRRLQAKLNCDRPEEVVQFLADNESVPTLYKNETELADPADQFPVLPDAFPEGPDEYSPARAADMTDTFDAFHGARAWYLYSLPNVPPGKTDRFGEPLPWRAPEPRSPQAPDGYDTTLYRMPRAPALIVFRQAAPRTQTYLADRLTKEGWFDRQTAWTPGDPAWPAEMTTPRTAQEEWQKAAAMWTLHGEQTALILSDQRRAVLETRAGRRGATDLAAANDPQAAADRAEAVESFRFLDGNYQVTNFQYFLAQSKAEGEALTIQARKQLFDADQARERGENIRAAESYRKALATWRRALAEYPDFHRPLGAGGDRQSTTEEATYEYELAYINLLKSDGRVAKRAADLAAKAGSPGVAAALLGPLAAGPDVEADYRQAAAEDELGLEVAAEAILSDDPLLKPQPGDPRAVARQEVQKRLDALLPPADRGPAAARRIAREVVNAQFPWMKELKNPPRGPNGAAERYDHWITPDTKDTVKQRLNLVRKAPVSEPPAAEGAAGAGEGQ